MASAPVFVVRNTFLEVLEEPSTPTPPPTKTAPGSLQEAPAAPQPEPRPGVLRRLFGARRGAQPGNTVSIAAVPAAALGTPVALQEKNTFVHFAEAAAGPPTKSAPCRAAFTGAASSDDESPPPLLTGGSPSGLGLRDMAALGSDDDSDAPPPVLTGGSPSGLGLRDEASIALPPPAPQRCCASLGSEGHAHGQCIPCLMQVRWQAGRCAEPCRFAELCGRCHEAHTEEELHRVQAAMRRLKRRGGAAGAAALSAAYVHGTAAPVGAGAGRVPQLGATVTEVSV